MPRMHGNGMIGMVDYISAAGYYGLIPMFPYEYGGGIAYNSIHNTGISNWIGGHKLLPKEWSKYTEGSRTGKPYNRVALTSRGPVSHGCTRLGSGHLAELRELLHSVETIEAVDGQFFECVPDTFYLITAGTASLVEKNAGGIRSMSNDGRVARAPSSAASPM